jgi:hypothetical protein
MAKAGFEKIRQAKTGTIAATEAMPFKQDRHHRGCHTEMIRGGPSPWLMRQAPSGSRAQRPPLPRLRLHRELAQTG